MKLTRKQAYLNIINQAQPKLHWRYRLSRWGYLLALAILLGYLIWHLWSGQQIVEQYGQIRYHRLPVKWPVSGQIQQVHLSTGQYLQAGQPLAAIVVDRQNKTQPKPPSTQPLYKLAGLQIDLSAQQQALSVLKREYQHQVNRQLLELPHNDLSKLKTQISQQRVKIHKTKQLIALYQQPLTTPPTEIPLEPEIFQWQIPQSGQLSEFYAYTNQPVQKGQIAAWLVQTQNPWLQVHLSEADYHQLATPIQAMIQDPQQQWQPQHLTRKDSVSQGAGPAKIQLNFQWPSSVPLGEAKSILVRFKR